MSLAAERYRFLYRVFVYGLLLLGLAACVSSSLRDSSVDASLSRRIGKMISSDFRSEGSSIQHKVFDNQILLAGWVVDETMRARINEALTNVDSGLAIYNEIQIGNPQTISQIASDKLLGNGIRTRMLAKKSISSVNYAFLVLNGKVYLMGYARNKTEKHKVETLIRETNGVRSVISYVKIIRK